MPRPTYIGDQRGESVLGERVRRVVHNATDVVLIAKVRNVVGLVLVEVVRQTVLDVLPGDAHIVVACVRTLHVIKSKCVQELVHDGSLVDAAVQLEVEALHATETTDVRPAAGGLTLHKVRCFKTKLFIFLCTTLTYINFDVVRLGGSLNERQAWCGRLDGTQCRQHFLALYVVQIGGEIVRHHIVGPAIRGVDESVAQVTVDRQILQLGQHDVALELAAKLFDLLQMLAGRDQRNVLGRVGHRSSMVLLENGTSAHDGADRQQGTQRSKRIHDYTSRGATF